MSKIKIAILIYVSSFGIIQPQTVLVGTGMGPDILIFDGGVATGINLNLSIHAQLSKIIEIEFRPGIAFGSGNFNGYELISNLKIFPFNSDDHLVAGLKLHANIGSGGISHQVREDMFILPAVGIGYKTKVQKTFVTFDLTFQKPYPNGVQYSYIANEYHYSTDFDAVISLNIGFAWQL